VEFVSQGCDRCIRGLAGLFEMAVMAMMGWGVEETWDWAAQDPVSYGSDHYFRGHQDA
jgi:hypothetical protein